jgi:hypothetical protein
LGSGVQRYFIWVMKSATESSIIGVGSQWNPYDQEIRSMKGSISERTVEVTDALLRENAEVIQNRAASPLDEVSLRYLKTILTPVEHSGAHLDDLLDISRMGRGAASSIRVNWLARFWTK